MGAIYREGNTEVLAGKLYAAKNKKFTQEAVNTLIRVCAIGAWKKDCAAAAGITPAMLNKWLEDGEQENAPRDVAEFTRKFRLAELDLKRRALQAYDDNMEEDWRCAQSWLLNRYPQEFGMKQSNMKIEANLTVQPMDTSKLSLEDKKELRRLQAKARGEG